MNLCQGCKVGEIADLLTVGELLERLSHFPKDHRTRIRCVEECIFSVEVERMVELQTEER